MELKALTPTSTEVKQTTPMGMRQIERKMTIPVSYERILAWATGVDKRMVQDAFPELNADQREFLLTGILPDEWDALFGGTEGEPE
jgi:hypothetical protein